MKKKFYGIIGSLMFLIVCMFTIGVYASVTQKHDTEGDISYDPAIQESYLLKDWQNKLTNTGVDLSTLTSITFTQQKQDIPIGTIPISIGAKDKTGTTQFDQNANCYDISAYIKNTSLVFYSPKIIYAPEDCSYLFSNTASNKLSNLATLSLKNFDTSNTTKLDSIFKNCSNISTLDLSSLAINVGATTTDFFGGCTNLKTIQTPKTTNVAIALPTLTNKSFYKVSDLTSQTQISTSSSSFVLKVGALVTANPNGGTISNLNGWKSATNPTKVVLWDNNAIGTLPDATKTGHAIDGWYTSETAGTKVTSLTTFNQNSTIFAHWNANACAITYKLNGGTNASGNPTSYNYSESSQTISSVNAPTKVGYDFAGWTVTNGSISGTTLTINAKADSVTLEANWTASKYTITYKDQGDVAFSGTHASGRPTEHTYGTATTLKGASKTGYTFGGWFANKECTNSAITTLGATAYTSNITLYAKWTKNNYNYTVTVPMTGTAQTVTITANGQSKTVNTNNGTATFAIPYGTKFTPSIKVAYTSGRYNLVWGTSATANRVASGTNINRGSELTMTESGLSDTVKLTQLYFATAQLSKNVGTDATYYIGTTNNPTTALTNSQEYYFLSNANITLYAKATFTSGKYNYTFGNTVATPVATGTVVNSGAFAPTYTGVTKTLTISQLYTLQAKANGNGTVTPASEIYVLRNGSASITATPTNATGYTTVFTNWAKTSGTCTIASTSSANTTVSAITSNTVVTATFTRTINSYTLTANANNGTIASTTGWTGTGATATKSVQYNAAYGTLPSVSRTGYTFKGWYTSATAGTKVETTTKMGTADATIYAQWTANKYNIVYTLNNGTNASGNPTEFTYSASTQTKTVNNPTRTGYTFAGWTVDGGTISGTTLTIAAGRTSDVTLTANWTANKYTITYKDQGDVAFSGTHASGRPTEHTYGTATTLKGASKTGYTFGGWFANKECTNSAITTLGATAYTSNITLYAKWTKNNYNYTVTVPMTGTAQTVTITANGQSKTVNTNNGTATFAIPYGTKFTPSIKVAYTSGRYNLVWGTSATANRVASGTNINRGSELTMTESGLSDTVKLTQLYFATAQLSKNVGTDATYYIGTTNNPTTALTNSQEYYFLSNANITLYAKATFTSGKYNYTFGNTVATPVATGTVVNSGAFAPTYTGVTKTLTISQLYTLQAKANGNGTVTPASEIYVLRNGSASITATPTNATGYTTVFTNWAKTSGTCTIASTSSANTTVSAITANTVVTATFTRTAKIYTVTYESKTNGGTTANQTKTVAYGSNVDLTLTATKDGWTFVGWNTSSTATTKLTSYSMPANDVTLYAIFSKVLTGTFNYYNNQTQTVSVTIFNKATNGTITAPSALGTPNGYTFRHWSTVNTANAAKTVDASNSITISTNTTYYGSYQKTVTGTFFYSAGTTSSYSDTATQTSTTATATQYMNYTGTKIESNFTVPSAVTSSVGSAIAKTYKGVAITTNSTTVVIPTTANTTFYAVYSEGLTFYYFNGTAHTNKAVERRMLSNGTQYKGSLDKDEPVPSAYDGGTFTSWQYQINPDTSYTRQPLTTGVNVLYAKYTKSVEATFNYHNGTSATTAKASANRYYVSNTSNSVSTFNNTITVPSAVTANRTVSSVVYTYRGVRTDDSANGAVLGASEITTANTTYYASYSYTVTLSFNGNGSTSGTAPANVSGTAYMKYNGTKVGASLTLPANPFAKTGYTLDSTYPWNTNTAGTGTAYKAQTSYSFTTSVILYAKWTINSYTLTANANNGTIATTTGWTGTGATATKSVQYNSEYGTLPTVTRTGFGFKGWFTSATGGTQVSGTTKMGTANATIYAQWDANGYTIIYNLDGGTNADGNPTSFSYSASAQTKTVNNPTKTGYTFAGWTVDGGTISGTTLTISAGRTSDVTLTANWTINKFTVTIATNNSTYGSVDKTSIADVPYGSAITVNGNKITINGTTVTATAKTITGYTTKFVNWTNATGTITAARTITANFASTINSYTLTANANNGTIATTTGWTGTGATATKSVQYNAEYGTLPTVSRTGYTFKGWYTSATNGTKVETTTKMGPANTTIYAQWAQNVSYFVNYSLFADILNAQNIDTDTIASIKFTKSASDIPASPTKTFSIGASDNTGTTAYTSSANCADITAYLAGTSLVFYSQYTIYAPLESNAMFKGIFGELTSVTFNNFDTSNVTNMEGMFAGCIKLITLNLSGFNTSKVADMSNMFEGCESLSSLDLSNFDMTKVTVTGDMLYDCNSLKTIQTPKNVKVAIDLPGSNFYKTSNLSTSYSQIPVGNASITLKRGYTLTANANNGTIAATSDWTGSGTTATKVVLFDNNAISNFPSVSRSGYTFKGWYTSATDGTKVETTGKISENTTIYAQWEVATVSLTATYYGGGNEYTETFTVDMNSTVYLVVDGAMMKYSSSSNAEDNANSQFGKIETDANYTLNADKNIVTINVASTNINIEMYGYTSMDVAYKASEGGKSFGSYDFTTTVNNLIVKQTYYFVVRTDNIGAETIEAYATFEDADPACYGPISNVIYTNGDYSIINDDLIVVMYVPNQSGMTAMFEYVPPVVRYNIIYLDQNGDTFSGVHASGYPILHTEGTDTALKSATKVGYTFGGWFTNSACTGDAITTLGANDYTSDITLYAKWTINSYTLTADANGGGIDVIDESIWTVIGNGEAAQKVLQYNQDYGALPECQGNEGYVFDGWYTDIEGGTLVDDLTKMGGQDKTIYAHYSPIRYRVTFYNDDTGVDEIPSFDILDVFGNQTTVIDGYVEYGQIIIAPNIPGILGFTLTNTTNSSYAFSSARWGTSVDNLTKTVSDGKIKINIGDSIYIKNIASTHGQTFEIKPINEQLTKNIGLYWYKEDTSYVGDLGYDNVNIANAIRERIYVTLNGSTTNPTSLEMGQQETLQGKITFKVGDLFGDKTDLADTWSGIYFDPYYGVKSLKLFVDLNDGRGEVQITKDTADFRIVRDANIIFRYYVNSTYVLTCNPNGGTAVVSPNNENDGWVASEYPYKRLREGARINSLPTATRTGYEFAGWSTLPYAGGEILDSSTAMYGQDTTIYALWIPVQYTIAYNLDGGTISSGNPTTYTYSTSAQTIQIPNAPTRSGYKFVKWTVSGGSVNGTVSSSGTLSIPARKTGTITLVAQWKKTYIVYFMFQYNTGEEVIDIEHTDPNGYMFEGNEYTYKQAYIYEGATGLPIATLAGHKFLGYFYYGADSCPSPTVVDITAEYQFPIDQPLKIPSDFRDWMYLYPVFERIDGYLSKNWKNSITNMSSVQSILFTSDSSKIPSGVTPVSVGAKQNGTDAWTSDCDTLDVKLYQGGTSLVVYCAGNLCVVDAQNMFNGEVFSSLTSLTLDNIDTSKVTSMDYMFFGCSNLNTLNLSNFDTSKVTSMVSMFRECSNLNTLNLSNFDTSRVTRSMDYMFYGCSNLETLNLSNFDTSKVTSMRYMFTGCSNLNTLDLSNFVTSNVTNMYGMFYGCRNLETLNLSNFDTSKVTDMYHMFSNCSKLQTLNISSFNIASGCSVTSMLAGCTSLRHIYSPKINHVAIELPQGLTFYIYNTQMSEIVVNTSGNPKYYSTIKGSMWI